MADVALFVAIFLACLVEAVEATTIVVAVGATRNWRSALTGTIAAIVALVIIVAIAGPAIMLLPLGILRLVVGALLLVFGLQWLRKAALRASGIKALHDEDLLYQKHVAEASAGDATRRFGVSDWYAFTLSFKGVLLEGLEVVFIVLTFATNQGNLPIAIAAAAAAIVVVVVLGALVRGPLSRVPENTLKFIVGVMLTTFGSFWGAEGAGAIWPASDAALLVLAPAIAVFCVLLVLSLVSLKRRRASTEVGPVDTTNGLAATAPAEPGATSVQERTAVAPVRKPNRLVQFGLFWYDFVLGDDWQVAVGVVVMLVITAVMHSWSMAWLVAPIGLAILIPYGTFRAARRE